MAKAKCPWSHAEKASYTGGSLTIPEALPEENGVTIVGDQSR